MQSKNWSISIISEKIRPNWTRSITNYFNGKSLGSLDLGAAAESTFEFFTPYHNTILIRDGDGKPQELLNGQAYDRDTGKGVTTALNPLTNTIRVSLENGEAYMRRANADHYKPIETRAFTGSKEDVQNKLEQMVQAAHYLNDQNLSYVPFAVFRNGQNSNSVVRTLVEAAKIDYPQAVKDLFTPGENRTILPRNWKDAFNALACAGDSLCGLIGGLGRKSVGAQVRQDEAPSAWRLFFNQEAAKNWMFTAPSSPPDQSPRPNTTAPALTS